MPVGLEQTCLGSIGDSGSDDMVAVVGQAHKPKTHYAAGKFAKSAVT